MTPQSTTGVSPAELMFGRRLRSHLNNIRPDIDRKTRLNQERQKQGHDRRERVREFRLNDLVYAKSYGSGAYWLPCRKNHSSAWSHVYLRMAGLWESTLINSEAVLIVSYQETNSGEVSEDLNFPTSSNAAVREHTTEPDGDDTLNQTPPQRMKIFPNLTTLGNQLKPIITLNKLETIIPLMWNRLIKRTIIC